MNLERRLSQRRIFQFWRNFVKRLLLKNKTLKGWKWPKKSSWRCSKLIPPFNNLSLHFPFLIKPSPCSTMIWKPTLSEKKFLTAPPVLSTDVDPWSIFASDLMFPTLAESKRFPFSETLPVTGLGRLKTRFSSGSMAFLLWITNSKRSGLNGGKRPKKEITGP